jgi:hypothetical protein
MEGGWLGPSHGVTNQCDPVDGLLPVARGCSVRLRQQAETFVVANRGLGLGIDSRVQDGVVHIKCLQVALVTIVVVAAGSRASAQHPAMPPGMTHEEHLAQMQKDAEMKQRGAQAMGFDQDTTTHHFRLTKSGGAIEVSTTAAGDTAGRDQIRTHFKEIAGEFAKGNFEKPFMAHAEVPPGAETMKRLAARIRYAFTQTARGGVVRIATNDAEARRAVHEFLRYQITEHATGDPLAVQK